MQALRERYVVFTLPVAQRNINSLNHITDPALATNLPLAYESVESLIYSLLNGTENNPPRVCIVIDGDPLPAKRETHKARAQKSRRHLKRSCKIVRNHLGVPPASRTAERQRQFLARFCSNASGWVRWWDYLKIGIATKLLERGCGTGFPAEGFQISVVTAPFEADPKVVEIASLSQSSAIISTDGDLHVYPFADNAIVS